MKIIQAAKSLVLNLVQNSGENSEIYSLLSHKQTVDCTILKRFNYDSERYFSLLKAFIEGLQLEISALDEHTSHAELRKFMHKIKGSAAILGAPQISDTASTIEEHLLAGDAISVELCVSTLNQCVLLLSLHIKSLDKEVFPNSIKLP